MSDFAIRNTGSIAQTWSKEMSGMKPPIIFGARTTTQQSVAQSKDAFKSYCEHNLSSLSKFVPAREMASFQGAAAAKFDKIVNATFDKVQAGTDGSFRKSEVHAALKTANTEAQAAIKELAQSFYGKTAMDWDKQVESASTFPKGDKVKVSSEAYGDAHRDFSRYVTARTDDMRALVPGAKLAQFEADIQEIRKQARETLRDAQAECRAQGGKMPASQFQATVREVHTAMLGRLIALSDRSTETDITPQVVKGASGGFTLIRKAPSLENLVLQGGGAKGVGNPPALLELGKLGVIGGLKHVVGTSAGALTAACLASGMSGTAFQALMDNTPMPSLADDLPNFGAIYPGMQFKDSSDVGRFDRFAISHAGGGKDFSAQKALAILDEQTSRSVGAFVDKNAQAISDAVGDGRITQQEADRLDVFKGLTAASFTQDRTNMMLTFNDLSILSKIKPETFKELTLTGFNKTDRQTEMFNRTTTPDMPVALAGRISMAIPVYFESVMHGGKEYVDGGVGSNVPSEAVKPTDTDRLVQQDAMAKTMVMVFDDNGKGFKTLHGRNLEVAPPTRKEVNDLGARVVRDASGADYLQTLSNDKVKTYASGPNVHVVFHGNVDTFDLNATAAQKSFAKEMATMKTLEQIQNKQNEAVEVELDSVAQALGFLSIAEKGAVVAQGEPQARHFAQADDYNAAKALYDGCRGELRS
ncbi:MULTISPECIES: patatin-like phospholipase family protein [unclassified Variovorax]|jgi:predicted acylesterase/phospholipase RssA|uniref:patatin-like phospholipase family protein n=1 Tax=unclassified Variovorax TaxID=663243 RepID=UPI0008CDCE86|nr:MULTISPECIES: patatin-like phospholipase family protein [unclassified Variovorax]SEK06283.1 Patatin-like phospholipase [Variovorax sp. OK202]SFD45795.1 Patatin-like phospholipase [Variovorax sp. OK212]